MNRFVYLDNNATTKISESVREKIKPYLDLQYGNPSSIYGHGVKVKREITQARKYCANLINCEPQKLIFTSGGSESNCSAFNSAINKYPSKKKIITTRVEHASILVYCEMMSKKGYKIVYLDVDENCNISPQQLINEVDDNTCLVSIQYANNEVGTVLLSDQVLKVVSDLQKKFEFDFHVDGVQGLGKCVLDVNELNADYVSFSGHKIHATKGIGLLYIKDTKKFTPLITGHQEFGFRGGTENVVGIVGIGEACRHIQDDFKDSINKTKTCQDYLEKKLEEMDGVIINAKSTLRLPNTTSVSFKNLDGNTLLLKLEQHGICVSTGSACNSESSKPSHVLLAMGVKYPRNTIRISIDENTTISQIDYFIERLNIVLKGSKLCL